MTDPLGITHESYADPLYSETSVAGIPRSWQDRDAFGRPIEEEGPDAVPVGYSYDSFGRLDASWNVDPADCITPSGGTASLNYQVDYEYDSLGRTTRETGPDGTSMAYSYDGLGRLLTEDFVDLAGTSIRKGPAYPS